MNPYPIIIEQGALARLGQLVRQHCPAHRYALIADHHVAELHGKAVLAALAGLDVTVLEFPAGEWNKTREQWSALTDRMLAAHIGRDGAVIGFGGGVAGDLAGFVAATYLRGIPVVQVPTSLLAMVDAAVGGKTGLDVPAGKNLVGAFHPPSLVVADPALLGTLPRAQFNAGMAEVVKHGVIADAALFAAIESGPPVKPADADRLEQLVRRSVDIKTEIVAGDEREHGRRAVLNYGHTVAHALETLSGYALLHGEAVAIGMVAEARLADALGIAEAGMTQRIIATLTRCALPVEVPGECTADAIIEAMQSDKKSRAGAIRFALPRAIGVMARSDDDGWTVTANSALIRQVLDTGRMT